MNIFVTGAAGFIGSHLAEELAKNGHKVSGLDNFSDYYPAELKSLNRDVICREGVEFHELDLVHDTLSEVLRDTEIIYHVAAQPGISATTPFELYLKNNIIATQRLIDTAINSTRLKMFVNISTSSVYGADATGDETTEPRPTSHYGVTKLAAEQLVMAANRDKDFPACSLRLFSVYGPRERPEKLYPRLIDAIIKNKKFPLYEGSKNHIRSYTYIDDIILGLGAIIENIDRCKGEIFNLGTDRTITTGQGIEIVEKIMGKSVEIETKPKRPGDQEKTQANIEKARKILNYAPSYAAAQGLIKEVDWYKNTIYNKIDVYPDNQQ